MGEDEVSEAAFQWRAERYEEAMGHIYASIEAGFEDDEVREGRPGPEATECAADVAALLVEAKMQLAPWNYWREGTLELSRATQRVVEAALRGMPSTDGEGGSGGNVEARRKRKRERRGSRGRRGRRKGRFGGSVAGAWCATRTCPSTCTSWKWQARPRVPY